MVQKRGDIELLGKPHPGRKLSEREFVEWCDEDTRAEWVDGEVIITPPDNTIHNRVAGFIYKIMDGFVVEHDSGAVFFESIQLRLLSIRRRRQPDLIYIAKSRLEAVKHTYIDGAPDLVVEVVSPDSTSRDYRDKFNDYETAGIPEYWIIDPLAERVEVYILNRSKRYSQVSEKDGRLHSKVLPGFYVKPAWLWSDPMPSWLKILKEFGIRI